MGPKVIRPDAAPPSSDDIVEFPGQPTMRAGSAVPPVRLVLPVNAGPRRGLLAVAAVLCGLVGVAGLSFSGLVLKTSGTIAAWQTVVFVVLWPIVAVPSAGYIGGAIVCLRDLARKSPVLTLSREGLYDRRLLDQILPWSDVARATHTYTGRGIAGVHLKLRHAVAARQNPFRLGTLFFYWRRRPDEVHVPLIMLDVKPYALAHGIARLVQQHGGEIVLEPKVRVTGEKQAKQAS